VPILRPGRCRSAAVWLIRAVAISAETPPPGGDLVSPVILGATMYILFELTIVAIRRSGR
jgi:Sec-independent protein secretion pathway component TatC